MLLIVVANFLVFIGCAIGFISLVGFFFEKIDLQYMIEALKAGGLLAGIAVAAIVVQYITAHI